jgi:hypothetical protein
LATELQLAASLLTAPPRTVAPVHGGGNNRLYRVEDASGRAFALKTYLRDSGDTRDRLGQEWSGLEFLNRHGVACVPRPVALDRDGAAALYDWIDGMPLDRVGAAEIDTALVFIATLHGLSRRADAEALPLAAEACLSADELISQVDRRIARFGALDDPRIISVLAVELRPARDAIVDRIRAGYAAAGFDLAQPIAPALRTLSPSDFGFHNALRTSDGIVFLDFEYFGWDDPVKLVADFLHHPGMALDADARRRFLAGVRQVFGADDGFNLRLALQYRLYGLRWVCILLNEFLPERWARRAYAGAADRRAAETRQLAKARAKLADLGGLPHDA